MRLPLLQTPVSRRPPIDRHGRTIGYLRLSLTRACHLRCLYCRPSFDTNPSTNELTGDEFEAVARHMVTNYGVRKIRLTGGDPSARKDLLSIIQRLASISGVEDLAMTTHGLSLAANAKAYAESGLRRVNISLDSLEASTFSTMTGADTLPRVLAGIDAAIDAFGGRVKLNTVVLKNHNEHHLAGLVRFAAERGVEIRFIELMPMGPLASAWEGRYVPEADMRTRLDEVVDHWAALPSSADSARRYVATLRDGLEANVGFITPMSCNFCSNCDRLRIASDGAVYPCLMDKPAGNIRDAVRPVFDPQAFDQLLLNGYDHKEAEHPHDGYATMTHIGG